MQQLPIMTAPLKHPMTAVQAGFWTDRSDRSILRLYQRGVLKSCGRDHRGRVLFAAAEVEKLGSYRSRRPGRPSELLAA